MPMTPEENEANIQEILRTCPGMTREKIEEWDKMGSPMKLGEFQRISEKAAKRNQDQRPTFSLWGEHMVKDGEQIKDSKHLEALRAYARMMNTLDPDCLAPLLADDLRYNSQWVFSEMRGKQEYLDYMKGKCETIAKLDSKPFAEIGELDQYPFGHCVIMAQGDRDNLVATVLIEIENGLVSRLDMCAVPEPQSARRTGEYPGIVIE